MCKGFDPARLTWPCLLPAYGAIQCSYIVTACKEDVQEASLSSNVMQPDMITVDEKSKSKMVELESHMAVVQQQCRYNDIQQPGYAPVTTTTSLLANTVVLSCRLVSSRWTKRARARWWS